MAFKLVGFNLQASLNDKIDEAAERAGMKRSEFIRNALCVAIKAQGIEILSEDLASNQGARNDMKTAQGRLKAEKNLAKARSKIVKRGKKAASKLALAFGKAQTPAESRSLANKAVKPRKTI